MKARIRLPIPAEMNSEQRRVYDEVLRTRPNASGPFLAWLHRPGLAQPAQALGAVAAIRSGASPELPTPRLRMLAEIAHALCRTKKLDPELFRRAESLFGAVALVEIVGVVGYYALVAYTLNAFEMTLQ